MSTQKYPQTKSASLGTSANKHIGKLKTNGYSSRILHMKRDAKRIEAQNRNAEYAALSHADKVKSLIPNGSTNQRKKLAALTTENPTAALAEKKGKK